MLCCKVYTLMPPRKLDPTSRHVRAPTATPWMAVATAGVPNLSLMDANTGGSRRSLPRMQKMRAPEWMAGKTVTVLVNANA